VEAKMQELAGYIAAGAIGIFESGMESTCLLRHHCRNIISMER